MSITQLALIVSTALVLAAAPVAFAEDLFDEPSMGKSSTPDEHLAGSEDLDSHHGESGEIDDRLGVSGDLDDDEARSEDPDDLEAGSQPLEDHEGNTTALQDLPDGAERARAVEQKTMQELGARQRMENPAEHPSEPGAAETSQRMHGQIAAVHAAKQELEEARQRAESADAAYSRMRARNYPSGEARLKIVDERKLAHEVLSAAEKRYDAALSGGGGPASYE